MKKNIIVKKLYLFVVVILLISSSANAVSWWQNENALNLFGNVFDDGIESYMNPGVLDWYSVEPWETEICSKDFSTEFENEITMGALVLDDRIYDLTIALNPEARETQYTNINGDREYLLTIGWYIQGIPQGGETEDTIKYKIRADSDTIPLNNGGDEELEFTVLTGTSGFYTNYTDEEYNEVALIIDSQTYVFDIQGVGLDGKDKDLSVIYEGNP